MPSLKTYFDKKEYKSTYVIGDRVRGSFNGIPIVGTVLVEHLVDLDIGPVIHIQLDLPIKINDKYTSIVGVRRNAEIERLPGWTTETEVMNSC